MVHIKPDIFHMWSWQWTDGIKDAVPFPPGADAVDLERLISLADVSARSSFMHTMLQQQEKHPTHKKTNVTCYDQLINQVSIYTHYEDTK